ncbi:MAG: shikimate dehydrogenase [Dermatophilaceae bacterium]
MLTTQTRRVAVLGSPIGHSLSPTLHRAAYRALGLSTWVYEAHEVQESALPGFVARLGDEWAGLSLTRPLKEAAFRVAAEVSDLARDVGAVNTLVRRGDSGWSGHNTDVYGVSQALREAGCLHMPSALVLGSGATARSVVAALAVMGCRKVTFGVRAGARPETLAQARRAGLEVDVVGLGEVAARAGDAPLVVSTLPAGAFDADTPTGLLLPGGSRREDRVVLDVVYAGWPTPLARAFEEAGAHVISGFEMLVHQAAEQVRLMTGLPPPVEQMRSAGRAALGST